MNHSTLCLLVLVLISLVFAAGCTDSEIPPPPVHDSRTLGTNPTGSETPGISLTPQSPSVIPSTLQATPVPVRIFNGEYQWAEYRINNTITLPPNPRYQWEYLARIERSYEHYNGIPAIHEIVTVTGDDSGWKDGEHFITKNGFHATENTHFERTTKRFLGGTSTVTGTGLDNFTETLQGDDTYRGDRHWGWLLISPFEEMNDPLLDNGTESVIVPAGTYPDTRKYSGNFHNLPRFPVTFWIAEGVPVPVQYRISNPGLGGEDPVQTFELTGWG